MLCKKFSCGAGALTLAAVFVGCGGSQQTALVQVTGKVLLNEEPLRFGSVSFQPLQGGQPAQGEIDSNGEFVLTTYELGDGAPVGRHRVKFACYTKQDPTYKQSTAGDSLGDSLIPERYTSFSASGIEVSVLAQGNAPFVFKLEADPVADAPASSESDAVEENSSTDQKPDGAAAAPSDSPKTGETNVE